MILITGGAGYIGSHTVKYLLNNGHECLIFDNFVYGHKEAALTKFIQGDLNDKESLEKVFKEYKIDAVVHFAAYAYVGESVENPQKYYENNLVGTFNLLNIMIANNVKKIVFSSTCASYGNAEYLPIDEKHPLNPINPYGKTKLMVEKIMEDYHTAYGLKYIALKYFNASGASKDGSIGESHNPETHLIPLVLKAIKGDIESITVFGTDYDTPDGTCIRDYIHVDDLATAHKLALEKLDDFNGVINLGTGTGVSVKEIIDSAIKVTGVEPKIIYGQKRKGDPAILVANNSLAKEVLGWNINNSDIDNIIETAWNWESNKLF
ncbi:UDP-glucose 4-epimerase GalE [Methanobrevibacter curvatus]|uniref:UDP-glucose 4-epimerase n=1 Tax=Methanobrevibacter curvatus TaxID=49547 RepID=A0A166A3Q8_9EURY|nr:UDP-glucose 4-epimerase GalE [Methanobrevibacter curvatus]KZX11524.1 UDP-glucose 4-epimerase [Methanobrevibacter curvatus]